MQNMCVLKYLTMVALLLCTAADESGQSSTKGCNGDVEMCNPGSGLFGVPTGPSPPGNAVEYHYSCGIPTAHAVAGNSSETTQLTVSELHDLTAQMAEEGLQFNSVTYIAQGANFTHILKNSFFAPFGPTLTALSNLAAPAHHHSVEFAVRSPSSLFCNNAATQRLQMCNKTGALRYLLVHQQTDGVFGKVSNVTFSKGASKSWSAVGKFNPIWLQTFVDAHTDHKWTWHSTNCQHFSYHMMVSLREQCRTMPQEQCLPEDLLAVLPFQAYMGRAFAALLGGSLFTAVLITFAVVALSRRLFYDRSARVVAEATDDVAKLAEPLL